MTDRRFDFGRSVLSGPPSPPARVGERTRPLAELYPNITDDHDSIAELHFQTDQLGLDETETRVLPGNNPFVRGAFPVDKPVFPFTSRA
jgi:hypothetical protein